MIDRALSTSTRNLDLKPPPPPRIPARMDTGNFLLECLPEELQQLLRKARQDPSRYLRDLFERLQSPEYQGYCTFHLFLDFYFQQFKTPPTGTVSFDNARAQIFALRGLYLAFCMGSKQLLKGKFESEWQTMWPWMNVLYRRLVVAEVWDKTHENYSMATMIESIMSTLLQPPINPKIVSTSGNVALMTDVYLYLGKHPPSDEDLVSRMRDASLAFLHLLSCPTSEVTEIRDVLGFHNEAAAKAFFQPLFMSIRGGPVWASTFRPLQRLHIQICHRNPTLYRDFPSKLVASYICEALSFFLDSASASHSGVMSKGSDLNEIDESVTLVIGFLALYARHAAVGHAWMVHAMRYDLLPLLIRSAAHGKKYPGMLDGIVSIVDTIRFNSMHRPVLRRIISGPGNFSLPNTLTDRKVRMAWVQLQDATGFATAVHSELTLFQTFKPQCSNRLSIAVLWKLKEEAYEYNGERL
ncbi:hypothetical protein H0H93_013962 [Arthromyces matolae]|nr:hypothetical protein H0H93_013962 [Arthromyces matolae]